MALAQCDHAYRTDRQILCQDRVCQKKNKTEVGTIVACALGCCRGGHSGTGKKHILRN
jgi:hypothetical protein